MKKLSNKVIGMTLAFIMVFMIAPTSVFAYDDTSSFETEQFELVKTRTNMLSQVREQLIEQDAIDHYHLYEKMIDTQLGINNKEDKLNDEEITISSSSSVRMSNGGAVYYSNYLNTGTEVWQNYFNKEDTLQYIWGVDTVRRGIIQSLIQEGLSMIWWPLGALASTAVPHSVQVEIRNGTDQLMSMHSDDGHMSSSIYLHWSTAPNVTIYSGAQISVK